jgi:hypothetical protein
LQPTKQRLQLAAHEQYFESLTMERLGISFECSGLQIDAQPEIPSQRDRSADSHTALDDAFESVFAGVFALRERERSCPSQN